MTAKELLKLQGLTQAEKDAAMISDLRSSAKNNTDLYWNNLNKGLDSSGQATAGGSYGAAGDDTSYGRLPIQGTITMRNGDPASWFKGGKHLGEDIAAKSGTPVPSVDSGTVLEAGFQKGWGNTVVVQRQDGTKARYAHLSQINVKPGQDIKDLYILGLVGNTGNVISMGGDGSHLHYQVYK